MVYDTTKEEARNYVKVFISKSAWERLPEPNDTTKVTIEYVTNVEYGESNNPSFWDFQFNLCTGYTVQYGH